VNIILTNLTWLGLDVTRIVVQLLERRNIKLEAKAGFAQNNTFKMLQG
jgi:hypothetical protein